MATIRKLKSGKFEAQVRRKGYAPVSRTFHKKSDAEEWARHTEVKADRGELHTPVKVLAQYTVKDVLERYRDEITVKKRSADTETYILDAFMREPIARLLLTQITPAHFSTYRDKRLKDVKAGTVNRELSIIKHAFDIAEREWDIPLRNNPLGKIKKMKVNNARSRRVSAEEYDLLCEAAQDSRNPYALLLIRFAIATGMRRGEILKLRWDDIDCEARTLHIPVTKNGHARTIPLSGEALAVLDEIQGMEDRDDVLAFPLSDNAAKLVWQRLLRRTGIEDLHFHDLRHEAISRFFEYGLSVPEVALISGHRDFRMLFRYTHLKAEDVAAKLNA
ncbi:MAG: integrase [Micavibrio sp.]|mgnify:CR=1 FL=1|nr:integrase [Micavibrio sp.]|tara:strand:+ start:8526 stop:9524 length:999 start_codon:yes stop_codon:yes gene_type:complete